MMGYQTLNEVNKVGQTHWKKELKSLIYCFNVYVCV